MLCLENWEGNTCINIGWEQARWTARFFGGINLAALVEEFLTGQGQLP